jgi:hypothetical protein
MRLTVEGTLTYEQAVALVDAVNRRYSITGLIHGEVGRRVAYSGGVDAGVLIALANLMVNLAGFVIKVWEMKKRPRRKGGGGGGGELTAEETEALLGPLRRGAGEEGFGLVRDEGLGSLFANQEEPCTLAFSASGQPEGEAVAAHVQTTSDGCAVFLEVEHE